MSTSRIKLLSGGSFDFVDLAKSEYTVEDIAHNLSNLSRFTGAVPKLYSVAQHSVLVSRVVPQEHALAALFHDSAEAFMNDLNTPLKTLIPAYKKLEIKVEREIFSRLGIPFPMHSCIKVADIKVFLAENRDLRSIHTDLEDVGAYEKKITPWTSAKAKKEFLKRFEELTK